MTNEMDFSGARRALVNYVLDVVGAKQFEQADFQLQPYLNLLAKGNADHLEQILTTIGDLPGQFQPPVPLDELESFIQRTDADQGAAVIKQLQQFREKNLDPASNFEAWVHTIQRTCSGILGNQRERGVSLYHEFKLLSALVHAAPDVENNADVMLVAGDFPGVQRIIYTITSDQAAKSVRGRSFFLQLLADCTVRRFLKDLGNLPITNAIYVAGGNFLLLTSAHQVEITGHKKVAALTAEVNQALLKIYKGDLSLMTATRQMTAHDLTRPMPEPVPETCCETDETMFQCHRRHLKKQASIHKMQFIQQLGDGETAPSIFEPFGDGGALFCEVCHRDPGSTDEFKQASSDNDEGRKWICPDCRMFDHLATELSQRKHQAPANVDRYLVFRRHDTPPKLHLDSKYDEYLAAITGWSCEIETNIKPGVAADMILKLNDFIFEPDRCAGFRMLAVHTPLVTPDDLCWLKETGRDEQRKAEARARGESEKDAVPVEGHIRDFELLAARRSLGFERLGILRMDVDGLGTLFSEGLRPMTITRLMAASDTLSLFFEVYLPHLCQKFEREWKRDNSIYLLYGGGDDLFIAGEWELMPYLAQAIRDAFSAYTAGQLSISAGIQMIPLKYPFYRAAEEAKIALDDRAKSYQRANGQPGKDAIAFLNQVFGWKAGEVWHIVKQHQEILVQIADQLANDTVTRNVLRIYTRWQEDKRLRQPRKMREDRADDIYYGPYIWLAAYQISRLKEQVVRQSDLTDQEKTTVQKQIVSLQKAILEPQTIQWSGPAARWAEFVRRTRKQAQEEI